MILQPYTTTGDVLTNTNPQGADIYIDDFQALDENCNILRTPIIITDVPKGHRTFTFRLKGYYSETVIVDVIGGVTSDAYAVLFPKILM